jgi:L-alanine-DL-glutamate epimerase-like enolase superfamily enzyme
VTLPAETLEAGIGGLTIEDVAVYSCRVPLPRPLLIGSARVTHRQYDVVRVRTVDGSEGAAYAFGRGLPVAQIVRDALAPLLVGADASALERVRERLTSAYWPVADRGLFVVAVSVVDLALWDMLGRRLDASVAEILGRRSAAVPICGVGGYLREGDGSDTRALQADVERLLALGCCAIKVVVGGGTPDEDVVRLAAVREVAGDDCLLVVDAFRSFSSLADALVRIDRLGQFNLAYLEDPFSETVPQLSNELRRRTGVLVGLGESLSGHRAFRDLIAADAVDVVRCDATVVGGVREFMSTAALASAHGLPVSTHVHPDIHVHFAAALGNLHPAGLEYIDPESGIDALHELLASQLEIAGGCAVIPERPGFGLDWDWAAVEWYDQLRLEGPRT